MSYDDHLREEGERYAASEAAGDKLGGTIVSCEFDWDVMERLYFDDPDRGAAYLMMHSHWSREMARKLLDDFYQM